MISDVTTILFASARRLFALAGDQMHAGRPFTSCTLRPLTGGGSPSTACRWFASDPGERCRQLPQAWPPGRDHPHIALVMAALAICAVTAALLKDRTDTQAPPPATRHP
jgi:hypothetical protein